MKKVVILTSIILALFIIVVLIGLPKRAEAPAEPTEAAETQQTELARAPGEPVDEQWFSDAVFVGDSVTLKLSYYCDSHPDALGGAEFFCAGSLGYANSLWDIDDPIAVHPFYRGANHLAEECAEQTGAKKVFVMLGMNDVGLYGIDGSLEYADELFTRILARSPEVTLYVQSVTPILLGHEGDTWNNENIRVFNEKLKAYCDQHGYCFIDVYSVMVDESGYLRDEYCSDAEAQGIHFSDAACLKWIETLKKSV